MRTAFRVNVSVLTLLTLVGNGSANAQTLLDDRAITIHSAADAVNKRKALIDFVWGTEGFPDTKLPDAVELDDISPVSGLPSLARVDTLVIEMENGQHGYAHHFITSHPTDRLVVFALGHVDTFRDDPPPFLGADFRTEKTLAALLDAGFSVLGVYMPNIVSFDTRISAHEGSGHWTMFDAPTTTGNPMKFFLEPVAVSLNYLKTMATAHGFPVYRQFDMVGLSGGGWTTTLYAAIDPTITISIPVAGSLPLYLRDPIEGDTEQLYPPFYAVAGYPDLYVLGGYGRGRLQVQVLNRYDTSAFGQYVVRPHPETFDADLRRYEADVREALSEAGAGSFRLEIDDTTFTHTISPYALTAFLISALRPQVGIVSNRPGSLREGEAVVWTAEATGGVGPFEYQFFVFNPSTDWRIVQPYSPSNSYAWTPSAGTYALQVHVRTAGSIVAYHGFGGTGFITVAPPAPVTVTSFRADATFPAATGTPITWRADATGGVGPLQYQFWLFDPLTDWTVLRAYGTQNTVTWTPERPGNYAFQVWVRSAMSPGAYDAYYPSGFVRVGPQPISIESFRPDSAFPIAAGIPVTWRAAASGGASPLHYKFWLFDPLAGWIVLRDYATQNSVTWTPARPGDYALQVWVRSATSSAAYDAYYPSNFVTVLPRPPVRIDSFRPDAVFPIATGTTVTWVASATGGLSPLRYKFWLFDPLVGWRVLKDYQALDTLSWTPTRAGTYALQVWVRETTSSAEYQAYASSNFIGVYAAQASGVTLSASGSLPTSPDTSVTWIASASGASTPVEYQFWLFDARGWRIVQPYSLDQSWTWTPAEAGTYVIQAWTRPVGSTDVYEAWASSGFIQVSATPP